MKRKQKENIMIAMGIISLIGFGTYTVSNLVGWDGGQPFLYVAIGAFAIGGSVLLWQRRG